jgi:hypothetical protein
MSELLTNEEKISIISQHMRNLEFADYNAYLDLLQANTISAPQEAIDNINARIDEIAAKKAALELEKQSLL